ncbi:PHA/PHB synthase family protein [Limoniibacter endophyticus]|uniref:Class I poly(R)-hydroxyalkanoic acid synthase n=1 Tax=Limoniibacter endophyticus TaxID=1565040 RepID=A0A8J3GJK7_9HYPH|nr:class I poly(R)-hydroxyalkanoic acid synthase [Limoniibacter endophyticus]GHC78843.1 class I poly(R)-hydroxyalkanoic acid synthase [Limoniibacter endophyticus]
MVESSSPVDKARQSGNEKSSKGDPFSLDPHTIRDPERLAANITRLMEEAQRAAEMIAERGDAPSRGDLRIEQFDALARIWSYWFADPARAMQAQASLFAELARLLLSLSPGADADAPRQPLLSDKRFRHADWSRPPFDFLRRAYLILCRWSEGLVTRMEDLDEETREKLHFHLSQLLASLSPSNFLLTNPEVLRETLLSSGDNLVQGMTMFNEDLARGNGLLRIRQTDESQFELGRNLANTPGKVVARSPLAEIIQYEPQTKTVLKRPLIICPPWINKFYILDLSPEKSFVRWALDQGHTVFIISWVNPDERLRDKGWEAYIAEGLDLALDTAQEATGEDRFNLIGYCVGGTLLASALAYKAKSGDDRVATASLFAAMVDFSHPGDLRHFVSPPQVEWLEREMSERGHLESTRMAAAFNMLRSEDLIWPYCVNTYLRGRMPRAFDLLYWNSDATCMTPANHNFYLRNFYLENRLARGELRLFGEKLSLSEVEIPIFCLAAKEDHIAPARSVYAGCGYFGREPTFVLTGSGHIAGVINPPKPRKYRYWSGSHRATSYENWTAAATEEPGSWWPVWQSWVETQDNARTDARSVNSCAALADAPGIYVR